MVRNNANFNYIVIGAGASGCIIANRLSADATVKVLLLEAGGMNRNADVAEMDFAKLWGSEMDWKLKTVPQKNMFNREVIISQGKIVGGSSAIDAMIYERGSEGIYDQWAAMGARGWAYEDVLPYFKKVEEQYCNTSTGKDQATPVSTPGDSLNASSIFINEAKRLGFNADHSKAAHYAGKNCKCESSATGFLHPVMHRLNLDVVTNAAVKRVIIESGTATGVEYVIDGVTLVAKADEEMIVCAGALASPKILMLSGVGPADDLRQLGIDVIHDLPGVGQNLQDHLQLPVIFRTEEPLPGIASPSGDMLFANTQTDKKSPDIRISFNPGKPSPAIMALPDFAVPTCIFTTTLIRPESKGTVRLASTDYRDAPVIDPVYLEAGSDIDALKKAIEVVQEIASQKAFNHLNICELIPGAANTENFVRSVATTAGHPAGTCKMGNDGMAVVDEELRVRGIRNLRVADASVMPFITDSYPLSTCLMIGEKAAEMIMEKCDYISSEIRIVQL